MANKSILEQALLQVSTLEEAVKANAKGILASTMKQELNDLLKEQEDEDPEEEEKDVPAEAGDDETSISGDAEPDNDADDADPSLEDEPEGEFPAVDDDEMGEPESEDDDTLDMTGASEAEVLKVFKAMKPEDGIVVKKDGNTVQFSDDGNDYIIKLDDDEAEESELPSEMPDEMPDEMSGEMPSGLAESDEVIYEIELDDEDDEEVEATEGTNSPFDKKVSGKRTETKEGVALPTKSPNKSDPFDKAGTSQGKKLRATEVKEQEGIKRPGTPPKGLGSAETKEPGKGGTKVTQSEKHDGTPPKGTKPAETKEPGKGGSNAKQVENHPGTPVKGEGKPVVKEPKEEKECDECGDKKVEATEAARTMTNRHGNKPADGPKRAGLPSKTKWATGAPPANINEEVAILRTQNAEYKKALVLFKDKINEVAVFNANLAYATRLFTEHSTTKTEKLNILKRFDSISLISESKTLYTAIKGELENKKPVTESMAEKIASTKTSSSTEVLSESKAYENPQFARMKELMRKLK